VSHVGGKQFVLVSSSLGAHLAIILRFPAWLMTSFIRLLSLSTNLVFITLLSDAWSLLYGTSHLMSSINYRIRELIHGGQSYWRRHVGGRRSRRGAHRSRIVSPLCVRYTTNSMYGLMFFSMSSHPSMHRKTTPIDDITNCMFVWRSLNGVGDEESLMWSSIWRQLYEQRLDADQCLRRTWNK